MSSAHAPLLTRERFVLTNSRGLPVRGELVRTDSARRSIVICHGFKGFYRWGFFPILIDALATEGWRVVSFNFSGSGVGSDLENFTEQDAFFHDTFGQQLADLALVIDQATARQWLGPLFALFGHSRGGGIAILHAARQSRVGALVTWASISHVTRWAQDSIAQWRANGFLEVPNVRTGQILRLGTAALDEVEAERSASLDIQAAASRLSVPWLIVHGTADETVPPAEAEALSLAAPVISKLLYVQGANHAFDVKHPASQASPALREAIEHTLSFLNSSME
ncbi:MAG: alpha/beta hydrolase family protein [Gemmatimonadaceae bacterium]